MDWKHWSLEGILLAMIVAGGAALRLYHLDYNSIWLDEAYTLQIASLSLESIAQVATTSDFMPPLFYWLEHFMLGYGNNEFILRLLPAVFGILTIPVIYMVGKEFLDNYTGYIIATAFAVSPFLVSYSQEARSYSMMLFLCACMMLAYLHIMKNNGLWGWFFFTIAAVVAFWTHYYSFLFVVPLVGFAAWKFREDIIPVAAYGLMWIALTFPLLIGIAGLYLQRTATATFGNTGIDVILQFFNQISGFSAFAAIFFLIMFGMGVSWLWEENREKAYLLVWLLAVGFMASVVLSSVMPMMPRYMIFLTIPFFLGVAVSYKAFTKGFSGRRVEITAMVFAMCFVVASVPFFDKYYQSYYKEDWRGFSQDLSGITSDGDTVVLIPGYISSPFGYYYVNGDDKTVEIEAMSLQDIKGVHSGAGDTYYVVTSDVNSVNPNGEIVSWLGNNTDLVRRTGNGIYLYKAKER